jgi:crossover junction endodeoxyribonuclease RuvC
MLIIGIDISITQTGYCYLRCSDCSVVKTGVIISKPGVHDVLRFSAIAKELLSTCTGEVPIQMAVIESYGMATRGQLTRMAELGGIIKNKLYSYRGLMPGLNLIMVAPMTLKKFATGYGKGEKSAIIKNVYKKWGFDEDNDNICDAYVLARIGIEFKKYEEDITYQCKHKYENEVMKAVAKQNNIKLKQRRITYGK